jgi:hypothetical protein
MSFAKMLPEFAKLLNLFLSSSKYVLILMRLAGLSSIMVLGLPS